MPQQTSRPYPMEGSSPRPQSLAALTQRNIELIAQMEATVAAKRSPTDYIADAITHFEKMYRQRGRGNKTLERRNGTGQNWAPNPCEAEAAGLMAHADQLRKFLLEGR